MRKNHTWVVNVSPDGTLDVAQTETPAEGALTVVAYGRSSALRKAHFAARTGSQHSFGQAPTCECGNAVDRKHRDGRWMASCRACRALHDVHRATYELRAATRKKPSWGQSDARDLWVAKNDPDQLDRVMQRLQSARRSQAELDGARGALIEVQKAWLDAPNIHAFARWLQNRIRELG